MRTLLALACALLQGCAVVVVSSDGGPPRLSAWPLGVRVERGAADAFGVKQWSLGLWQSCWAAGLGASKSFCVVMDDRACTAMILDARGRPVPKKGPLERLAQQAEFSCLNKEGSP